MIYLDYAATTPLDPRVFDSMKPYFEEHFGNASSVHQYGQVSRRAIDDARNKCIELVGAFSVHEIIFTGGGTESCNTAITGAAFARQEQGKHIIISAIEHPAVREPAEYLRDNFGFELTEVAPDKDGIIHPEKVALALRPDTILVSVMLVNNEVGTIQPIKEIAKIAREHGALFHTDACQAPGFTNFKVDELKPDLLTISSSKIYGPKGIGLLYIREGVKIKPLILGGGQEFRMRAGTENPALIVGFTKALELIIENSEEEAQRIAKLRDRLLSAIPNVKLNGCKIHRSANNINIHTPGITGETLVMKLDMAGLAASSGSACASGKTEASPTLLAMGQSEEMASQSLRLTLGRPTTEDEVIEASKILNLL